MIRDDLKCVLLGLNVKVYKDLAKLVRNVDRTSRFKQVELTKTAIVSTLKKINGPCLIFISDELSFSLELLSDLTWQYNPDAIVVIVSRKSKSLAIREPFNNTQFSRVKLDINDPENNSVLPFLIQAAKEKAEFRRCKNLLGVSEKRCQWLVDSSTEAVAFISRDMHLYANVAYLNLFGVASVQSLRSITVKDFILSDEHLLFDGFQQNQSTHSASKRSIILSMVKKNGSRFRANAYLIPSVFKGHKCYQFWVRELNALSNEDKSIHKKEKQEREHEKQSNEHLTSDNSTEQTSKAKTAEELNPFSALLKQEKEPRVSTLKGESRKEKLSKGSKSSNHKVIKKKKYNKTTLLKELIRNKVTRIEVKSLSDLNNSIVKGSSNSTKIYFASLKLADSKKHKVDSILSKLPENQSSQTKPVFWDQVKFSRLLQIISKKKELSVDLIINVEEASIRDESFINWLTPGLEKIAGKSRSLIFLIPSNTSGQGVRKALEFIKILRQYNCKIALDNVDFSTSSVTLLKHGKPDLIKMSSSWVSKIEGNELNEFKLSSTIRQLERNNIKVIAPSDLSKDSRKLFILSGASFCQENL